MALAVRGFMKTREQQGGSVVEGLVGQWSYWDIGFLFWGAIMAFIGWVLLRTGRRETADAPAHGARA